MTGFWLRAEVELAKERKARDACRDPNAVVQIDPETVEKDITEWAQRLSNATRTWCRGSIFREVFADIVTKYGGFLPEKVPEIVDMDFARKGKGTEPYHEIAARVSEQYEKLERWREISQNLWFRTRVGLERLRAARPVRTPNSLRPMLPKCQRGLDC